MYAPYEPRPVTFLGVEPLAGYRVKMYSIRYGEEPFDRGRFAGASPLAESALPQPAQSAVRPGVGFAILHQGCDADYFVLGWWDRENELPLRVFVRGDGGWRPASRGEGVCVWDLCVIWAERESYVNTILNGRDSDRDSYLSRTFEGIA